MNRIFSIPRILGVCLLAFASGAHAELPPDVLVRNGWVQLTRADYDVALARVPEKLRFEFTTSPKRIQDLLNNLLLTKTLAAQARAHGIAPEKSFGVAKQDDGDRALAAAELARVEADARKSFEARRAEFEAKALELYKAEPGAHRIPEELRLSDIAVLIKERGDEAARQRAAEARAKLAAGADFAAVALEYSDDRTTRDKGGQLPFMPAKRMAPDYAKMVFALKVGEISAPIKAPAAYHVVRLDERRAARVKAFEEVRESILETLRKRYVAEQRELRIQSIFADARTETNQPVIDALVNRVDPQVFRKGTGATGIAPAPK